MTNISNTNDLIQRLVGIGNVIIYLLMALAFIYIIWQTVMYFIKSKEGDESRKESGKNIIWGIIGLAIIMSIWGLVNILLNTFGTYNNVPKDRFPSADFVNSTPNTSGAGGTSGFDYNRQDQGL
jgi:hypothetical protein